MHINYIWPFVNKKNIITIAYHCKHLTTNLFVYFIQLRKSICICSRALSCRCIILCAHSDSLLSDLTSLEIEITVTAKKLCTACGIYIQLIEKN